MSHDEFSELKNRFHQVRGALRKLLEAKKKHPGPMMVSQSENDELVAIDNDIDELLHQIYGQQLTWSQQ